MSQRRNFEKLRHRGKKTTSIADEEWFREAMLKLKKEEQKAAREPKKRRVTQPAIVWATDATPRLIKQAAAAAGGASRWGGSRRLAQGRRHKRRGESR